MPLPGTAALGPHRRQSLRRAVGYHVGLRLADYWKLDDVIFGQTDFLHFADGTAHKNRMQGNDFVQSVMYRHGVCVSTGLRVNLGDSRNRRSAGVDRE